MTSAHFLGIFLTKIKWSNHNFLYRTMGKNRFSAILKTYTYWAHIFLWKPFHGKKLSESGWSTLLTIRIRPWQKLLPFLFTAENNALLYSRMTWWNKRWRMSSWRKDVQWRVMEWHDAWSISWRMVWLHDTWAVKWQNEMTQMQYYNVMKLRLHRVVTWTMDAVTMNDMIEWRVDDIKTLDEATCTLRDTSHHSGTMTW
jgi:hypothetical protein